jgi:predicted DNA-binding WGR domain protein
MRIVESSQSWRWILHDADNVLLSKNNKYRIVPLNADDRHALGQCLAARPRVQDDHVFLSLSGVAPARNRNRLYRLSWQTILWGEGELVRRWGRRGSEGRSQLSFYPDQASTQREFQRLFRLRLRHGYRPVR